MTYELQDTVDALTTSNNGQSVYLRAIRLFEFQVYLFCPKWKSRWRGARLFAAIKLLEHIELQILRNSGKDVVSLKELASDPNYAEIFDKVLAPSGGWRRIRRLLKEEEFDDDLQARRIEAKDVAKFVDFSYRYAALGYKLRRVLTMARFVVAKAQSYSVTGKRSTLKTHWREYSQTGGFLYLIFIAKFDLRPQRVAAKDFAEKLFSQAKDVAYLRDFFRSYKYLAKLLKPYGYNFMGISIDGEISENRLPCAEFPEDVRTLIKNYKSVDDD